MAQIGRKAYLNYQRKRALKMSSLVDYFVVGNTDNSTHFASGCKWVNAFSVVRYLRCLVKSREADQESCTSIRRCKKVTIALNSS